MFKKFVVILLPCLVAFGCSAVKSTTMVTSVNASVVLTGQDLFFGDMVTASMVYEEEDTAIKEKVMAKAIGKSDYDFILLPKFLIETPTIGKPKITVTGRGAKLRNK